MARASVFETQPVFAPGLSSWLARNRAWDIEYGGFRTNHLSHNWVAMAAADAADEQMQWWLDLYCGDLEQPHARNVTAHPEPARRIEADWPSITPTTWADHLSDSRELYPAYLEYFDREIAEHGRAEVIERHVPALLHGIAGAALHPVIHAGFGLEADHDGMLAEGLAYMCVACLPVTTSPPDPAWSPDGEAPGRWAATYLASAREEDLVADAVRLSRTPPYQAMRRGGFQQRFAVFRDPAERLGPALDAMGPLGLPALGEPLEPVLDELARIVAALVLASDGEFFVIHAATSLHGLLVLFPHLDEAQQRVALAHWWRASMATTTVQGCPGLDTAIELLSGPQADVDTVDDDWWRHQLRRTLHSTEEHLQKAVYVMWRWASLRGLTEATRSMLMRCTTHLTRENESGDPGDNVWIALADA